MNIKDIKSIKISLLEKDKESKRKKKKLDFIIKSSANINMKKILEEFNMNEEEYEQKFEQILTTIYEELLSENRNLNFDYIGVWIFSEEKEISNSINISLMNNMEKYGYEEINPLTEFIKMTIENES